MLDLCKEGNLATAGFWCCGTLEIAAHSVIYLNSSLNSIQIAQYVVLQ